jgi:hypothetical protein
VELFGICLSELAGSLEIKVESSAFYFMDLGWMDNFGWLAFKWEEMDIDV